MTRSSIEVFIVDARSKRSLIIEGLRLGRDRFGSRQRQLEGVFIDLCRNAQRPRDVPSVCHVVD